MKINLMRNYKSLAIAIFSALAALLALTACHNDDPMLTPPAKLAISPALPSGGSAPLKSVRHNGNIDDCYDWTLNYSDNRLMNASGTRRNSNASDDYNYSYSLTLTYDSKGVYISHSDGRTISVALDGANPITWMPYGANTYPFSSAAGRLNGWQKTETTTSLGQTAQYTSKGVFTRNAAGDLIAILYTDTRGKVTQVTLTPSTLTNPNGLLPETVGKEMGIDGFEALYYAGLLGVPAPHLTESISKKIDGKEEAETTDFSYSQRGGNTVLCTYKNGSVAVNYGY